MHTTPANLQLDGTERDKADLALKEARKEENACKAASELIVLGAKLERAYHGTMPAIMRKVREAIPDANTRVQRSYGLLMMATLEVCDIITC